jgi:hypothetical protein
VTRATAKIERPHGRVLPDNVGNSIKVGAVRMYRARQVLFGIRTELGDGYFLLIHCSLLGVLDGHPS